MHLFCIHHNYWTGKRFTPFCVGSPKPVPRNRAKTLHISTAIEQEVTDYHHLMEFLLRTFFANKTSTQILKDLSNTFTDLVRFPRTFKGPRIFKVNWSTIKDLTGCTDLGTNQALGKNTSKSHLISLTGEPQNMTLGISAAASSPKRVARKLRREFKNRLHTETFSSSFSDISMTTSISFSRIPASSTSFSCVPLDINQSINNNFDSGLSNHHYC